MANSSLTLRPRLAFVGGQFQEGLRVRWEDRRIVEIVASTDPPDCGVLTPAFVNAHSHLEYRGLMDLVAKDDYLEFIKGITRLKATESEEETREHTMLAAKENVRTGVGYIAEHSDRPFAAAAMRDAGLKGVIFQEVITFREWDEPEDKVALVEARARSQIGISGISVYVSPHAIFTVDPKTLGRWKGGKRYSMHVAETEMEDAYIRDGRGPLAEFHRRAGRTPAGTGLDVVEHLDRLGLVHTEAQWVHGCAIAERHASRLADAGVALAHCPRSNEALGCPRAPIAALRRAGVRLGIGMDSAASSGPIDYFAEMRAAYHIAELRGDPLSVEEIWAMATTEGAASLGLANWEIAEGNSMPCLLLESDPTTYDELLDLSPEDVQWP